MEDFESKEAFSAFLKEEMMAGFRRREAEEARAPVEEGKL